MARQFVIVFLLLFSSLVIVFGGYNCSQQVPSPYPYPPGGEGPPLRGGDGRYPSDDGGRHGGPGSLPEEPDRKCNSEAYRNFRKRYGASAVLDFNYRNITDYREGAEPNYELECSRLFLDMEKMEGTSVYEGRLAIVYQGDDPRTGKLSNVVDLYDTGDSTEENKYNTWRGSWGRNPSADFVSIFESTNRAIILRITDIKKVEVRDGEQVYKGYGSVWFKVFRLFKRRGDICYNEGGYVSHAHTPPSSRPDRCWFLDGNPFGCKPQGSGRAVNLRGSLTCYKKLAEFGYLDIHKAFNLEDDEDHP